MSFQAHTLSTTNEHEELNMTQARIHRGKLTTEKKRGAEKGRKVLLL